MEDRMSGSAAVRVSEIDLSTRVPSFPGVFGGIVIPAKKGPVNQAVLVTSETQLLKTFTPNERVDVGFDLSYFSAIAYMGKSDKLWVARSAKNSFYAGASFKRVDSATLNQSLPSGQNMADPLAYLFDSNPDVPNAYETTRIECLADMVTPAVPEVVSVTTVPDTAGSLHLKYFILYDDVGSVGVWYDIDNAGGTAPAGALAAARQIEISTVNSNDDEFNVAQKTQVVIEADAKFAATVASNVVTVTNSVGGARTDATVGDSGFTIGISTQGVNAISSLNDKYFVLYDDVGSVAFWFDVDNGGSPMPTGAGSANRQVEINTIAQGDVATAIATKVAAAVNADVKFGAVASGIYVTVTDASFGARTDATSGNSGFTMVIQVQGSTLVNNVDELMLIYASSQGIWGNDIAVKIVNFSDDEDAVLDNESFIIEVYKSTNLASPIESHQVSRVQGKLDGFGRNMYVEDVLKSSSYIRAFDNIAIAGDVVPKSQLTALSMAAGSDGAAVTDAEMQIAADSLANPDDLLVTVLMDGGRTSVPFQIYLDAIAQNRKDCVAILSTPFAAEADSNYMAEIVDFRKTQLNLNSSFSALYTPHVSVFDKFNDRNIYISPDGHAAGAISQTASNFEIWYPPAGFKRGLISVLDVRRRFTKGERDVLYNAGINPIRFAPGQGIAIWGQKTLSARPSALDRLNVRLLLISIQPAIAKALEDFIFDLNDDATRSIAQGKISAFMDNIKGRRGVTDFKVVCDSSNNTAEDIDNYIMNVDVFIKPTRSLEFINFRTILVSTGDSFESAQQAI